MPELHSDQATGLRRLVARHGMRVLAVAAGCRGAGGTTAVANIAAALAVAGHHVLAVEEDSGAAGVARLLGLGSNTRCDSRHAYALDDLLVRSACGVTVLAAERALPRHPVQRRADEERVLDEYARLGERFDIALIDGSDARHTSPLGCRVEDVVLVASAAASALTGAYGVIKRCAARHEHKRFHVLVNDVATTAVAQVVFGNLARAARDYLDLPLSSLGWVPRDGAVQAAASRRQPVVTAVPGAPSALGFGRAASSIAGWPRRQARNGAAASDLSRVLTGNSSLHHATI